jgi:hypothetical protein
MLRLRKKLYLFNIFILAIGLISCSRERIYEIKIVNETDYYLNKVSVGKDTMQIAVGPNQTSGPFEIAFTPNAAGLFSQPLLGVTVLTYSDSTTTFENSVGEVIAMNKLHEGRTNFIYIKLAPPHPNVINPFSITAN